MPKYYAAKRFTFTLLVFSHNQQRLQAQLKIFIEKQLHNTSKVIGLTRIPIDCINCVIRAFKVLSEEKSANVKNSKYIKSTIKIF